jgi:hypothetical protein
MAGGLPHVPVHDLQVPPARGRPRARHPRPQRVPDRGGPPAQAHARRHGQDRLRLPDQRRARRPEPRYGEHPWITWPRQAVVARVPYWATAAGPVTIAIKDENGSVWQPAHGHGAAGDERARIRPRRGRQARGCRGGGGQGQGAGEGSAGEGAPEKPRSREVREPGPSPSPCSRAEEEEERSGPRRPPPRPASRCSIRSWSACSRIRCGRPASGTCPPAATRWKCARAAPPPPRP